MPPQELAQHESLSGSRDPGALARHGFASSAARRRQEAKIRVLLGRWMAERGQGFRGDVTGIKAPWPNSV